MVHNSGEARTIATEWADRCASLLSRSDWERVCTALGELHDQLREEIPDEAEFEVVFPYLVSGVIHRLGDLPIETLAQAQVYASSAQQDHRALADTWMQRNRH